MAGVSSAGLSSEWEQHCVVVSTQLAFGPVFVCLVYSRMASGNINIGCEETYSSPPFPHLTESLRFLAIVVWVGLWVGLSVVQSVAVFVVTNVVSYRKSSRNIRNRI